MLHEQPRHPTQRKTTQAKTGSPTTHRQRLKLRHQKLQELIDREIKHQQVLLKREQQVKAELQTRITPRAKTMLDIQLKNIITTKATVKANIDRAIKNQTVIELFQTMNFSF